MHDKSVADHAEIAKALNDLAVLTAVNQNRVDNLQKILYTFIGAITPVLIYLFLTMGTIQQDIILIKYNENGVSLATQHKLLT